MKTIWKYPLQVTDMQTLRIPKGARLLATQAQGGEPSIWAIVDPDAPKVERVIAMFGTGHPLPDQLDTNSYIGTFQLHGGAVVFHVFDGGETA